MSMKQEAHTIHGWEDVTGHEIITELDKRGYGDFDTIKLSGRIERIIKEKGESINPKYSIATMSEQYCPDYKKLKMELWEWLLSVRDEKEIDNQTVINKSIRVIAVAPDMNEVFQIKNQLTPLFTNGKITTGAYEDIMKIVNKRVEELRK